MGTQREDYLLRMIAQMARVLAHVRRLLTEGKNAEAAQELSFAAQKGGIDLRFVIALDEVSLRPMLLTAGELDRPKCAFFAELVSLEWRRQLAMGESQAAERCARRALLLYALAFEGVVSDGDILARMAELEQFLTGAQPTDTA